MDQRRPRGNTSLEMRRQCLVPGVYAKALTSMQLEPVPHFTNIKRSHGKYKGNTTRGTSVNMCSVIVRRYKLVESYTMLIMWRTKLGFGGNYHKLLAQPSPHERRPQIQL